MQGEVTLSLSKGCSPERLGTVPYNLVARVPLWRGQGEVTHCSSLVAFPFSLLVNPAERLETVPYNRHYMLAM